MTQLQEIWLCIWHEKQDSKAISKHFGKMSVRIMIKPLFQEVSGCDIRFIQLDAHTFIEEVIFII